jgi:hypothetical protein
MTSMTPGELTKFVDEPERLIDLAALRDGRIKRRKRPVEVTMAKSLDTFGCDFDLETKVRHVRDPEYWGLPYGAVIPPGYRPVGRRYPAKRSVSAPTRAKRGAGSNPYNLPPFDADKPYTWWVGGRDMGAQLQALPDGTRLTTQLRDGLRLDFTKEGNSWVRVVTRSDGVDQKMYETTTTIQTLVGRHLSEWSDTGDLPTLTLPGGKSQEVAGSWRLPEGAEFDDWANYLQSAQSTARTARLLPNWSGMSYVHSPALLLGKLDVGDTLEFPKSPILSDDNQPLILEKVATNRWRFLDREYQPKADIFVDDAEVLTWINVAEDKRVLDSWSNNSNLKDVYLVSHPGEQRVDIMFTKRGLGESGQRRDELLTVQGYDALPVGALVEIDADVMDVFQRQTDGTWVDRSGDDIITTDALLEKTQAARANYGSVSVMYGKNEGARWRSLRTANYAYDRDGYDRNGYDEDGYDRQGYDVEGYDSEGYDADGYDVDGNDVDGISRNGNSSMSFDVDALPTPSSNYNWGERQYDIDEAKASRPSVADLLTATHDDEDVLAVASDIYNFTASGGESFHVDSVDNGNGYDSTPTLYVRGSVLSASGGKIGTVTRVITLNSNGTLVATNDYLSIQSGYRGTGFASEFNRRMEDWYIANGFDSVKVHADIDVGGYAWARDGFDWSYGTDPYVIRQVLERISQKDETGDFTEDIEHWSQVLDDVQRGVLDSDELPTPFELSNIGWRPGSQNWVGKKGMLGSDWHGVKYLQPEARALARAAELRERGEAKPKKKKRKIPPQDSERTRANRPRYFEPIEPRYLNHDELHLTERMSVHIPDYKLVQVDRPQTGVDQFYIRSDDGYTYTITRDTNAATVGYRRVTMDANDPAITDDEKAFTQFDNLEDLLRDIQANHDDRRERREQEVAEIESLLAPRSNAVTVRPPVRARPAPPQRHPNTPPRSEPVQATAPDEVQSMVDYGMVHVDNLALESWHVDSEHDNIYRIQFRAPNGDRYKTYISVRDDGSRRYVLESSPESTSYRGYESLGWLFDDIREEMERRA